MATSESVRKSNGEKTAYEPARQCHQVTLDWLNVYAQVYRETLTQELILAYQAALSGMNAQTLDKAFMRAMRSSTFRPTPAEVLQAYRIEFENAPKPKQLDLPQMSEEERIHVEKAFDELRGKLKLPTQASTAKRREELKRQAREVIAKYGKK